MSIVTKRDGNGVPRTVVLTEPWEIELWGAIHAAEKLRRGRNGILYVDLSLKSDDEFRCELITDHTSFDGTSERSLRRAIDRAVQAWKQAVAHAPGR